MRFIFCAVLFQVSFRFVSHHHRCLMTRPVSSRQRIVPGCCRAGIRCPYLTLYLSYLYLYPPLRYVAPAADNSRPQHNLGCTLSRWHIGPFQGKQQSRRRLGHVERNGLVLTCASHLNNNNVVHMFETTGGNCLDVTFQTFDQHSHHTWLSDFHMLLNHFHVTIPANAMSATYYKIRYISRHAILDDILSHPAASARQHPKQLSSTCGTKRDDKFPGKVIKPSLTICMGINTTYESLCGEQCIICQSVSNAITTKVSHSPHPFLVEVSTV